MCGIAGIINLTNNNVEQHSIETMMRLMKHRGPDDEGLLVEDNVGLGFVRLSIIDLSPLGHQPMFCDENRYVIIFNGEIFNYIELRTELESLGIPFKTKTDTEVLLKAYIQWGESCLHKLNGMWAFVIYDRITKNIFASRDRFGIKPFYYSLTDTQFAFCSEIPPLLSLIEGKPKANFQTIYDFLIHNRNDHTENTFFESVKKLQHGMQINVVDNNFKIKRWYNLKQNVARVSGFNNSEEYYRLFTSAVKLQLRSDVPIGVCLSGGIDSSCILSSILENNLQNEPSAFSAVFGKDQMGDESEFINAYKPSVKNLFKVIPSATSLENDLLEYIACQAEPIPSTSAYSEFKVMELQKNKAGVTITGQGADEALAGYDYFYGFYFRYLLSKLKLLKLIKEIYYYLKIHRSLFGLKTFLFFLTPKKIKLLVRSKKNSLINEDFIKKYYKTSLIAGNLYDSTDYESFFFEHFEYKLEHHLIWSDRSSMHFSIEARVPFLDYRLIEKTLATKKDLIIRNGISKYILREAMKPILPDKIKNRTDKVGYETPQAIWFREKNWQVIINELLNSESFSSRNLINITEAKQKYNQHLTGKIDISREIWKWIHLELWFRKFIDSNLETK